MSYRGKEQPPPQDLDAERACLGSMMVDQSVIHDVLRAIPRENVEAFFMPAHRILFSVVCDMWDENKPIDLISVKNELVRLEKLGTVGGIDYVADLAESIPSTASAGYYAELVRDKYALRELLMVGRDLQANASDPDASPKSLLDEFEAKMLVLSARRVGDDVVHVSDPMKAAIDELDKRMQKINPGDVPTGWRDLDEQLSGLHRGEMIVIAARPSMGKTAFGLQIADSAASSEPPIPTLFFSLEMSEVAVCQRLLCMRSSIDSQKARKGMLNTEEWDLMQTAGGSINESKLYIDDSPLTLFDLRAKSRNAHRLFGIQLIVIDYLQLMRAGFRTQSRQDEVREISAGIKNLAKSLNIPIIVLAQLNRNPEARAEWRPRMSDLRESGSIEQDADVVILLHREEYYRKAEMIKDPAAWDKIRGVAEIIVDKQRNGPTGIVNMFWDSTCTRFGPISTQQQQESLAVWDAYSKSQDKYNIPVADTTLKDEAGLPLF